MYCSKGRQVSRQRRTHQVPCFVTQEDKEVLQEYRGVSQVDRLNLTTEHPLERLVGRTRLLGISTVSGRRSSRTVSRYAMSHLLERLPENVSFDLSRHPVCRQVLNRA